MLRKSLWALGSIGILGVGICAATATKIPNSLAQRGNTRIINTATTSVEIEPITSEIFRVTSYPIGKRPKYQKSQSAILTPDPNVEMSVTAFPDEVLLHTATTNIRVDRKTGTVSFYDVNDDRLITEAGGVDNTKDVKTISFFDDGEEIYYGAGERGHSLKINGDTLVMYNRQNYGYTEGDPRINQMNITVPYFVSDLGYGILFDDYNAAKLVMGDTITYTSKTSKPLSYYFINGEGTLAGATSQFSQLTGRQELPPFWALGYITSKYGYKTQDETIGVIDTLKSRGYPVDGIVLDLYWYGQETDMGRLEWNKEQWPDHKKMLADLKKEGVNLVAISQPYVNKIGAIDNYNYLAEKGMLTTDAEGNTHDVTTWVGDAGMLDVSNPQTRKWLWERYKSLTDDGIEGWWGDLGEPEVHPLTIYHSNGESASEYHNVYGNEWSRLLFEGFKKEYPERRLMLLMRGGTAGLQRYNVFPWSTDVSRSWGGLQPQVKIMLNSGLSGLGYMSSDIGGFAVDEKKPLDPELYVRWLQMGAFTPVFRTHAQLKPEPYNYPQQEPISKKFIKMRYEWLPYNYTLAYENAAMGLPLARPLNFNGENPDEEYANIWDEYLWGDNVLVAPVMKAGARSRKVTFPAGEWVNWNNPMQKFKGGTTATVAAPLDQLPMFVKAGSFIPQYPEEIENVTQYNPAFLDVVYFPSKEESSYTMFEDDRQSPNSLADNAYSLVTFTGRQDGGEIVIDIDNAGHYEGMPQSKMITLRIPGLLKSPKSVDISSEMPMEKSESLRAIRQSGWTYDRTTHTLFIRFPWAYDPLSITVR